MSEPRVIKSTGCASSGYFTTYVNDRGDVWTTYHPPRPVITTGAGGGGARGGGGGLTFLCRSCGQASTRFSSPDLTECSKCRQTNRLAGGAFADAVERITNAGRVAKPEPTHCGCGASFATVKRFTPYTGMDLCGDCYSAPRPQAAAPIDVRIRDAREGRDEDPTTWTAGATPGWEWP